MRTGTKLSVVFAALFFVTPFLRAADVQWPDKFGELTATSAATSVRPGEGDMQPQPILVESGLESFNSRTYRQRDRSAQVSIYRFHDSSGAYQAYTAVRSEPDPTGMMNVVLVNGNVILWVHSNFELTPSEMGPMETWERSVSDGIPSPPIATYLPTQNIEPQSERYALNPAAFREIAKFIGRADAIPLGDEAGFSSHAEAMFAKYKSGKDAATLLLIDYPTPQLAELHMRHLRRALADAKLTSSSIERKGSLLSIVLAPTSAEYAEKLRSSVNYETQVTWNEARQVATDPPILSTVAKIFIATGVFMVVTVVIGIAFGGVRIITKRLFPGKVFDRKNQMEVLQLGLSGKPIDPSDMY